MAAGGDHIRKSEDEAGVAGEQNEGQVAARDRLFNPRSRRAYESESGQQRIRTRVGEVPGEVRSSRRQRRTRRDVRGS